MYEDEPQDKVHDVLAGAIFGDHPLGRPIIGRADVVSSVPVPEIASWHDGRYVPGNMVLAAAGNLEHERIVELAEQAFGGVAAGAPAALEPPERNGQVLRFHQKETEQYHLCLGAPGHPARRRAPLRAASARHDPRRLDLVAALPGGAREARPRLLGLLVREPLRRHRPGGALRGHAPGQRGGGGRRDRLGAPPPPRRRRERGGARAGARQREGPHGAVDGVDAHADEPARELGADGRAAPDRGRAARGPRRRYARGRERTGSGALAARAHVGRRASAATSPPSAARSRQCRRRSPRHDQRRRVRRGRADGADGLRRRRGRRRHGARRAGRTRCSRTSLARPARRRRRGRGLLDARFRARERTTLHRGRGPLRDGDHRGGLLLARGRREREPASSRRTSRSARC